MSSFVLENPPLRTSRNVLNRGSVFKACHSSNLVPRAVIHIMLILVPFVSISTIRLFFNVSRGFWTLRRTEHHRSFKFSCNLGKPRSGLPSKRLDQK
ncbi:hypothetical protein M378DRAFT_170717, partial [Amanita muscaria Koide BX008]